MVRVDGKTGVSGAGRAALESTSFGATEESIRPYRVPAHQHTPEIERGIELAPGQSVRALFVPHLVPGGLDEFVDTVIPELQDLGSFRTEYTGPTLRDHLGLAKP